MAIAFVQSRSTTQTSGSSLGLAPTGAFTAGNCVIVAAMGDTFSGTLTISDGVNTYTALAEVGFSSGGSSGCLRIFYVFGVASGSPTITVSAGTGNVLVIAIHEFSGLNTIDQTNSNSTTGNSQTSNNVTTTVANELLFGFTAARPTVGTITTITKETGWTLGETAITSSIFAFLSQYNIVSSTQTVAATTTTTLSKSGGIVWSDEIATFYQSSFTSHLLSNMGMGG